MEILCDGSVLDPPHTLAPLAGAGTCTVPGPTSRAMCEFQQGRWVPSMSATTAQAQKYGSRSAPPALEHARARCSPRVANSELVRDVGYLRIFSPTKCSNMYRGAYHNAALTGRNSLHAAY